jgi:hypothetical protein
MQKELRAEVSARFKQARRRPFRGEVAIHLALRGVPLNQSARVVKGLLDSVQGPVFEDDRAVGLLDVVALAGSTESPTASITACSLRAYTDAYDILMGALTDRDLDHDDFDDLPNPWYQRIDSDHEIDLAREHLAWARADTSCPPELRESLIELGERQIREYERGLVLNAPFSPIDRPGPVSIRGRCWNEYPHFVGPGRIVIPAPDGGGRGSWTQLATATISAHIERWFHLPSLLMGEPVALDIAIGQKAANCFDLDNLAQRILKAFRQVLPGCPHASYRAYRREGDDESVVVHLHDPWQMNDLRQLLNARGMALWSVRPDPDAHVRRTQSTDEKAYAKFASRFGT